MVSIFSKVNELRSRNLLGYLGPERRVVYS